ncbi:hypothetical protein R1sor_002501 [Riccia sorocarpa]|uniref:Uncharacterized protein n=1 Tax=Riccia sorocarpa TaxID=122646 RepID=A0ABD3H1P5_9MARC
MVWRVVGRGDGMEAGSADGVTVSEAELAGGSGVEVTGRSRVGGSMIFHPPPPPPPSRPPPPPPSAPPPSPPPRPASSPSPPPLQVHPLKLPMGCLSIGQLPFMTLRGHSEVGEEDKFSVAE